MENIPDILLNKIYKSIPAHRSNIDELKTIWEEYLNSLKIDFPQIFSCTSCGFFFKSSEIKTTSVLFLNSFGISD